MDNPNGYIASGTSFVELLPKDSGLGHAIQENQRKLKNIYEVGYAEEEETTSQKSSTESDSGEERPTQTKGSTKPIYLTDASNKRDVKSGYDVATYEEEQEDRTAGKSNGYDNDAVDKSTSTSGHPSQNTPINVGGEKDSPSKQPQTVAEPKKYSEEEFEQILARTKDWNAVFQRVIELPDSVNKFRLLSRLAKEFAFVAETYGRVIISELNIPLEYKSIKPLPVSEATPRLTYRYQGILFKFAEDTHGIFGGSDDDARKSAGNDMKGLTYYAMSEVKGLHFPLIVQLHYLGHCLVAMSILPISKKTLCYGSNNGGQSIVATDEIAADKMKEAAERLNLRAHYVGPVTATSKLFYGPANIECHRGKDELLYVVDFTRVFPPEAPLPGETPDPGWNLTKLLRPELVISWHVPLSPDAFSVICSSDPNFQQYNTDVFEATKSIFIERIPKFVESAFKYFEENSNQRPQFSHAINRLLQDIHKFGINYRHLGYVRRMSLNRVSDAQPSEKYVFETLAAYCLIEMIARIIKNKLFSEWRKITKLSAYISEEQCKEVTVELLNRLFHVNERKNYWNEFIKPQLLFKYKAVALTQDELAQDCDYLKLIEGNVKELLTRIEKLSGLTLTSAVHSGTVDYQHGKFLVSDVLAIKSKMKHLDIVNFSELQALLFEAIEKESAESARLLQIALQKLDALTILTAPIQSLFYFGKNIRLKIKKSRNAISSEETQAANSVFELAHRIKPKDVDILIEWAKLTNTKNFDESLRLIRQAIELQPTKPKLYIEFAKFVAKNVVSPHMFYWEEARTYLLKALELDPISAKAMVLMGCTEIFFFSFEQNSNESDYIKRRDEALRWFRKAHVIDSSQLNLASRFIKSMFLSSGTANTTQHLLLSLLEEPEMSSMAQFVLSELTTFNWNDVVSPKFQLSDAILFLLARNCRRLTKLILRSYGGFTEQGLVALIESQVSSLQYLQLEVFEEKSDESSKIPFVPPRIIGSKLCAALEQCIHLESLKLECCNQLDKASIYPVLQKAPLSVVYLPGQAVIDNVFVETILSWHNYKDLNFSNCSLNANILQKFVHLQSQNLQRLALEGIPGLSVQIMTEFLKQMPNLIYFNIRGTTEVPTFELLQMLAYLEHPSLQIFVFPQGYKIAFSGAHQLTWKRRNFFFKCDEVHCLDTDYDNLIEVIPFGTDYRIKCAHFCEVVVSNRGLFQTFRFMNEITYASFETRSKIVQYFDQKFYLANRPLAPIQSFFGVTVCHCFVASFRTQLART